MAILRNRLFLLMRELYSVVPVGPEVRLGVNRVRRRLIRRGPLGTMAEEMQEVLGEHTSTANLLVAEERIRAHLAQGQLAQPHPDEVQSNGASIDKTSKSSRGSKRGKQTGRAKARP